MNKQKKRLWLSIYTVIGSTIGVGIFSIPYTIAQSGYFIGLAWILGVALMNLTVLLMYAEVIMFTPGHSRLTGLVRRYLGPGWGPVAGTLAFLNCWGAMLTYIVVGGIFLKSILGTILPMSATVYQLCFAGVLSAILFGGLGLVSVVERYLVWALFTILLVLIVVGMPHMEVASLFAPGVPGAWFLPFGPLLFAFSSFAAIPEAASILSEDRARLRTTILTACGFITLFYIAFATTTVMISGGNTSVEAIQGLASVIGSWFLIAGSLMGLVCVSTSFITLGVALVDALVYDFRIRYIPAWALACFVPIILFLLGARDLLQVISITGGVFGGSVVLFILATYTKARHDICMPKRCLSIPRYIVWILAGIYMTGIALELFL